MHLLIAWFFSLIYIILNLEDLIAEAELLSIASEIFRKLKDFNQNNCKIRLNHVSLIEGILMYSGIERARHLEICSHFSKFKVNNKFKCIL